MSRFILYRTTEADIAEAKRRAQRQGVLKSSVTKGKGRMTGFLGEVAFGKMFPEACYVGGESFSHDYEIFGKTVDIKSASCSKKPQENFNASVIKGEGVKLPADIYYFMWVQKNMRRVYLGGWCPASTIEKPKFYKHKGDGDGYGFKYHAGGYRFPIAVTKSPDSFEGLLGKEALL